MPEKPAAPVTSISGSYVKIKWNAPDYGGSAITSYTITILTSDGTTYKADSTCDGSKASIVSTTECLVPISTLI